MIIQEHSWGLNRYTHKVFVNIEFDKCVERVNLSTVKGNQGFFEV